MQDSGIVMKGSLDEFGLPDVLQCVGVSRQHTVIQLKMPDGTPCGFITMKAGQVLQAKRGSHRGKSAFVELFLDSSPGNFAVFRLPDQDQYARSLGPLATLLVEALAARARATHAPVADASPEVTEIRDRPVPPSTSREVNLRPVREVSSAPIDRPRQPAEPRPHSGGGPLVVAIASPKGGSGKTTIALNLALSLANRGLRTVIVDGDINGDILSIIDARGRINRGAYDILDEPHLVGELLRSTTSTKLKILPACGPSAPTGGLRLAGQPGAWSALIDRVKPHADVTLIDCPPGMFHTTQALLEASTHTIGVFQSDMVASRSFSMFSRGLAELPRDSRPALAGVVVNMFRGHDESSIEAFQGICGETDRYHLFETTIPRSPAFNRAAVASAPLREAGAEGTDAIAWLFDSLAAELCERLQVEQRQEASKRSFLV